MTSEWSSLRLLISLFFYRQLQIIFQKFHENIWTLIKNLQQVNKTSLGFMLILVECSALGGAKCFHLRLQLTRLHATLLEPCVIYTEHRQSAIITLFPANYRFTICDLTFNIELFPRMLCGSSNCKNNIFIIAGLCCNIDFRLT